MPWNPTGWNVARRTRAPHERPRNYNDPSKQHELESFYDRSTTIEKLKVFAVVVPLLLVIGLVAFIAFNILSS